MGESIPKARGEWAALYKSDCILLLRAMKFKNEVDLSQVICPRSEKTKAGSALKLGGFTLRAF